SIGRFGDVLVLKNKFTLPFGYGYDKYVKLSDFEKLSPGQKDYVSTVACVLNDEDIAKAGIPEYSLKDTVALPQFTIELLKQNTDALRKNSLTITEFSPVKIKAAISLPAQQVVYTSLPFDKGWSVTEN